MAVQSRLDINNQSPIINADFKSTSGTLLQDAGRTDPFLDMTVLGQVAASGKYVPLDPAGINGSENPVGIYRGAEISAASIAAGDVSLTNVIIGGNGIINEDSLIFDDGVTTLATVIGTKTVRTLLEDRGIFLQKVTDLTSFEN